MTTNIEEKLDEVIKDFDELGKCFYVLADFSRKLVDAGESAQNLIDELDKHDIPASSIHLVLDIKKKLKVVDDAIKKGMI